MDKDTAMDRTWEAMNFLCKARDILKDVKLEQWRMNGRTTNSIIDLAQKAEKQARNASANVGYLRTDIKMLWRD